MPEENRESGESPERSRHCERGAIPLSATAFNRQPLARQREEGREGAGERRSVSQKTCPVFE